MMNALHGKTALITGATGGMGAAIAHHLAKENVNLVLLGRDFSKLKNLRDKIAVDNSVEIEIFALNLEGEIDHEILKQPSVAESRIDILVYAAGVIIPNRIEDVTKDDFVRQFNVNFKSAFGIVRSLLAQLKERSGQIVLINSSIISNAKSNLSVYGATKHALAGFTEALRNEVNPSGVRVMNLIPGKTATRMQAMLASEMNIEMNRELMIQPEDIANTLVQALKLPFTAEITDVFIRPMRK